MNPRVKKLVLAVIRWGIAIVGVWWVVHRMSWIEITRLARSANPWFLLAAVMVLPVTYVVTSFRWHELLKAVDVNLPTSRTFVLNMVGAFYSTFMLGSTGGDVLRAWYVAKQTHHRTRAVMSVLVDRAVGLMALIILGGTMAALQWQFPKCRQIAVSCAVILLIMAVGLTVFYVPVLRRRSGLHWVLGKLPMAKMVASAIETMDIYGRRPGLCLAALICSFPVHMVVIVSATLAGKAFSLPISPLYYWTAVPVIVLVGSIPISPQGAGVMEFFAINLLAPLGCTMTQAVALTMSIRLAPIFWNLTGGIFVLRGGYHAPTAIEQKQVEQEDMD